MAQQTVSTHWRKYM